MDADVAEVDVEHAGGDLVQRLGQAQRLAPVDGDRPAEDLFLPEAPELVRRRLRHDHHVGEGKLGALSRFWQITTGRKRSSARICR